MAKPFADRAFISVKPGNRRFPLSEDQQFLKEKSDPLIIDIQSLLNSKTYRRMQDKAQVFPMPENPHVRDRLSHTGEVVALSMVIADSLGLNTYLCQAIALGHDFGHPPFGHAGEEKISQLSGKTFLHEVFSVIIAQKIERRGEGLNLCHEVLEGILCHSKRSGKMFIDDSSPLEYDVVSYCDGICYIFADINDFARFGREITGEIRWVDEVFGKTHRARINTCFRALYEESVATGRISFQESDVAKAFELLKKLMFDAKYPGKDHWYCATQLLEVVYQFFANDRRFANCNHAVLTALLTDQEVWKIVQLLTTPMWPNGEQLKNISFTEIIPCICNRDIDISDPDLDWQK